MEINSNGLNMKKNAEAEAQVEIFKVAAQDVRYFEAAVGYLARPRKKGVYPGVIMIHEYWGLSEHVKEMARELAKNGYAVLAVDLYNGQVTADPERAMKLVSAVRKNQALENMQAAAAYLRNQLQAEKIASIGWCFGGGQSLQLALSGEKLDGTIIYYGNLETDKKLLKKIHWPVLGIFGDRDAAIPVATVREFETALQSLHIVNEIYVYPGVGHAFANPSNPKHAPVETRDAWEKTLAFLNRNLKYFFRRIRVKIK